MAIGKNEVGWNICDTLDEYWNEWMPANERDFIWIQMYDGAVDAKMGKGWGEDEDVMYVLQIHNTKRYGPLYEKRWTNPPPRTGLLDRFIADVEGLAGSSANCRYVCFHDVMNEFLPEKLERRGYSRFEHYPWPNYVKAIALPIAPLRQDA